MIREIWSSPCHGDWLPCLREPLKRERIVNFLIDDALRDVARVHVDGDERDDLDAVGRRQVADDERDDGVELLSGCGEQEQSSVHKKMGANNREKVREMIIERSTANALAI
jgi:hypothetical protein